jgi:phosphate transport system permease protein
MTIVDSTPGVRPIPAPQRPWRSGFTDLRRVVVLLIASLVVAALAVEMTGLRGRLGFVFIFVLTYLISAVMWSGLKRGREAAKNALAESLIALAALAALLPLGSLLWTVFEKGREAFYSGYLVRDMQFTQPDGPLNEGGALHALIGTLLLVLIATAISVPLGILTGLYLTEIKGRFEGTVRFLVQSMSGVPSIVAGLFIYAIWILGPGQAYSGFAGALALTILMLPTVARTAEEVLKLIPRDLREAGLALGATQWRTVGRVVIPAARSGLITSAILGIARVSGETAPLLLTIFGTTALNLNPFEGPLAALPLYIFSLLTSGLTDAIARAWTGALVLMALVLMLFTLARLIGGRKRS